MRAVVEVDEMRAVRRAPQHVAGVAVAVQPQRAHVAGALEAPPHAVERLRGDAAPGGARDPPGMNPCASSQSRGSSPKRRDVERGPGDERPQRADRVDASEEAAHPFERRAVLELRRAAAALRVHGEAEAAERVQRACPSSASGATTGISRVGELGDERVLLEDLRVGPARGPVELRDHRRRRPRCQTW